jgi:hypothetical protein
MKVVALSVRDGTLTLGDAVIPALLGNVMRITLENCHDNGVELSLVNGLL